MNEINKAVTDAEKMDALESVTSDAKKLIELILDMPDDDIKKILFLVEGVRIGENTRDFTA